MAPRANWKGYLKVADVSCPVSLFTAASTSDRIAFHTLNRETGHRLKRQFVDQETGKPVPSDDQVKGYETGSGDYVVLEPDEITAAIPDSDKTLSIEAFVSCGDIDDLFFDRPYYLAPSTPVASESFAVLREGMRARKVAAVARTVLFRRVRSVLVRVHGEGLIATTLNFDYEVRSPKEAFGDIPAVKIDAEMLELARHIIKTKTGTFDPSHFDDRYEDALAEVVRAKLEGKAIAPRKAPTPTKVVDLMEALRQSAKGTDPKPAKAPAKSTRRAAVSKQRRRSAGKAA